MTDVAPDVSIVIVSYNVRELVARCVGSILATVDRREAEVIVVDNASTDGTEAEIRPSFPAVVWVANAQNRGFGAANNQGLRLARGRQVMFLNPDAELTPGALAALRAVLDRQPDVAVVGPKLRYPSGAVQPSRRRFPTIATALVESTVVQRWWPRSTALRNYYVADRPDDESNDVDWLVGACLLGRRAAIEAIGGFDERYFMYSEELDLCRRLRQAGWRVVYVPSAEVIHHEGQSSEQNLARRAINFNESKARYFETYAGAGVGRALRLFLLANTLFDLTTESAKLALGHKPDLRRARVRALREVAGFQARHLGGHDARG